MELPETTRECVAEIQRIDAELSGIKVHLAEMLPQDVYKGHKKEQYELVKRKVEVLEQLRRLKIYGDRNPQGVNDIDFDDDGIVLFRELVLLVRRGVLLTQLSETDRGLIESCEEYLKLNKTEKTT